MGHHIMGVNVEEYRQWLIRYYSRWYGDAESVVETLIEKMQLSRGLTREQAIIELYRLVYPYLVGMAETRRAGERVGVFELFKASWRSICSSPALAMASLIGYAALLPLSIALVVILFGVAVNPELTSLLNDLVEGNIHEVLSPKYYEAIAVLVAMIAVYLVFAVLFTVLGSALEGSMLYSKVKDLFEGKRVSFTDLWCSGVKTFGRAIKTAAAVYALSILPIAVVAALASILLVAAGSSALSSPSLVLVFIVALLVGLLAVIILMLLFMLAVPAAVIDGLKPLNALRYSAKLVVSHIGDVLLFIAIQGILLGTPLVISAASEHFKLLLSDAVGLVTLLLFRPLLGLSLGGLYLSLSRGRLRASPPSSPGFAQTALRVLKRGLREVACLIRQDFTDVCIAWALYAFFATAGYLMASGPFRYIVKEVFSGGVNPVFNEYFRLSIAINIFSHNWQAIATTAVSGIFTPATPAAVAALNGVVIGMAMYALTPAQFITGILPHGIVEIPCFIIAIAAGLNVGRAFMGKRSLVCEIRRAALVSVGLAPLLLLAGLIEALVTPELMALIGGLI